MPRCDYQPPAYDGPSRDDVLRARKAFCNPALLTYYPEPIMIVDGHMQYLFDESGHRYLDLIAGIVTVSCGHCHPKVLEKIQQQLERLQHTTTIYLHPNLPALAEKLASKMPDGLDVTYFTNSGSEANDLAILMSRLATGNDDIVAVRNGYHGGSAVPMGLTSHNTWKFPTPQSGPIHHAVCPDPYRSPFDGTPDQIAAKSADDLQDLIRYSTPGAVAAFIAEPIQGVGGATHGSPAYLGAAYSVVRENGGLCIADEVQTGFGRTGTNYWGFQNSDVVPDMVTLAKGFGNGIPIGAVTTRREIADALTKRIHFNTFGGNPVSMAAGLAVMEVIDEEGFQENCRVVGGRMQAGFRKLQERHDLIGDVRGMGLMLGVELVTNRETKEPATNEAVRVLDECRKMGVLIGRGGLFGNVLRIKPPMCINEQDADFALEVLDGALEIAAKGA